MSAQPLPRLTPEQYLEIERAAEFKSEYYCGTMYAMAGGTYVHNLIIARTIFLQPDLKRAKDLFIREISPADLNAQSFDSGFDIEFRATIIFVGNIDIA